MPSIAFSIISLLIPLGFVLLLMAPAILILRGKSFWAAWMMAGGVGLLIITMVGQIGFQAYLGNQMAKASASSSGTGLSTDMDRYIELMQISSLIFGGLSMLAFLTYVVGIWGVGKHWQTVSQKARELENLAQDLAAQRGQ
ncbi:MAG: hypothetical protein Q7Q71_14700 [Verrucomicrobiota bacterium JB023]|nr:hypothetical protein [Verrucomicrobiota bacterium JB023]